MDRLDESQLLSRRRFLGACAATACLPLCHESSSAEDSGLPIIDIHQHTNYHGRTDAQLVAHQRQLGITTTILLPAGRPVGLPITDNGRSDGLAAGTGGNASCRVITWQYPREFTYFANDVPGLSDTPREIAKYLKLGARGIGEQKFNLECDSPEMMRIYELAEEFRVPVLLHFQYDNYNKGFERFGKVLERFRRVNFIGHAQTWWANIDNAYTESQGLYPKGKVTAGGLTDQYLTHFRNMYADISAGSGLNSLTRDPDHARGFLSRHQDRILFGTDCDDSTGKAPECQGAQTLAAIRSLSPTKTIERKILYSNAKKLFRL